MADSAASTGCSKAPAAPASTTSSPPARASISPPMPPASARSRARSTASPRSRRRSPRPGRRLAPRSSSSPPIPSPRRAKAAPGGTSPSRRSRRDPRSPPRARPMRRRRNARKGEADDCRLVRRASVHPNTPTPTLPRQGRGTSRTPTRKPLPPCGGGQGGGCFPPRATMIENSLPESELAARFAAAQVLAREAGALAIALRGGPASAFGVETKSTLDFATEADRAVERLVIERLGKRFGDDMLGEEYGSQRNAGSDSATVGDRVWVVDPIDGTFNFIHGLEVWCVSLAFLVAGEIEFGIIYNPATNELFAAKRGRGAFLDGERIRVSGARHAAPLIEIGCSNRRPVAQYLDLVGRTFAAGCEFRRLGSGALGLASVAAGRTDGYLELHINAWDVLAGIVPLREAGGWTNDFLAGDGLRKGNQIIACTPELRETLTGLIAAGQALIT